MASSTKRLERGCKKQKQVIIALRWAKRECMGLFFLLPNVNKMGVLSSVWKAVQKVKTGHHCLTLGERG